MLNMTFLRADFEKTSKFGGHKWQWKQCANGGKQTLDLRPRVIQGAEPQKGAWGSSSSSSSSRRFV